MKNKTTLALIALLIILSGVLIFLLTKSSESETVVTEEETGKLTFGEEDLQRNIPNTPAPSLTSSVDYSPDFSGEAKLVMEGKISETRTELQTDPTLYETWIQLGNQYKIVGDYSKAIEAWNYAGLLSPNNAVSFHNLGDLYGYFLNDPVKAEQNFLKAISNVSFDPFYYIQASEFYRLVMGDINKARGILEQGLEENPELEELENALNVLNSR